jgi:hypothetical protein
MVFDIPVGICAYFNPSNPGGFTPTTLFVINCAIGFRKRLFSQIQGSILRRIITVRAFGQRFEGNDGLVLWFSIQLLPIDSSEFLGG